MVFGENLGSGFQKILNAWPDSDRAKPELFNRLDIGEADFKANPYITLHKIAEILDRKPRTIQDRISKLKAEGRIRRAGPATFGGHWEVDEP